MVRFDSVPFGTDEVVSSAIAISIVLSLRIWGRGIKKMHVTPSDYITIGALVTVLTRFALKLPVYHWRFHSQDGHLVIAPQHALRSAQLVFASEVVFATSIALVKISILLGYRELFYVLVWVKRFIWLMIAACIVILASNTAGLMTMCAPFEANYDPDIKGVCRVSRSLGASLATVINVVVDVILVVIPVCVVWTLKINTAKKIGISLMFGLGLLIVVVAGLRVHVYQTETMSNNHRLALLSSLELHLGLIAACLPFIGPAFVRIGESSFGTWFGRINSQPTMHMKTGSTGRGNCRSNNV